MRGSALRSSSVHVAAATVWPRSSSISWALMPRLDRNTAMRGRSALPRILARTRRWRRWRCCGFVRTVTLRLPPVGASDGIAGHPARRGRFASLRSRPLAHLSGHVLALVADALALVGLRRPLLADRGGDLADELLGDPLDDHARGLRDLELDAVRRGDRHGVGEAERELEPLALELRPVADPVDLQRPDVPVGHALDHVGHERAREPVQGARLSSIGRALDDQLLSLLRHDSAPGTALGDVAHVASY